MVSDFFIACITMILHSLLATMVLTAIHKPVYYSHVWTVMFHACSLHCMYMFAVCMPKRVRK